MKYISLKGLVILFFVSVCTLSCSNDEEVIPVSQVTYEDAKDIAFEFYNDTTGSKYRYHCSVYIKKQFYPPSTPITVASYDDYGTPKEILTPAFYSWMIVGGVSPDETGKYQWWEMVFINAEEDDGRVKHTGGFSMHQIIELNDKDFERFLYKP